jgi:hypothetical protein
MFHGTYPQVTGHLAVYFESQFVQLASGALPAPLKHFWKR